MAECGEFEISDGVAILTLSAPPGNALTPAVRLWLSDRVSDAEAAPDVFALLLLGAGGSFSTGLDLAEYDGPLAAPHIADLCMQLEQCRKPVVAGLEGAVLGAGLELALAAHYRVAAPSAQIVSTFAVVLISFDFICIPALHRRGKASCPGTATAARHRRTVRYPPRC